MERKREKNETDPTMFCTGGGAAAALFALVLLGTEVAGACETFGVAAVGKANVFCGGGDVAAGFDSGAREGADEGGTGFSATVAVFLSAFKRFAATAADRESSRGAPLACDAAGEFAACAGLASAVDELFRARGVLPEGVRSGS